MIYTTRDRYCFTSYFVRFELHCYFRPTSLEITNVRRRSNRKSLNGCEKDGRREAQGEDVDGEFREGDGGGETEGRNGRDGRRVKAGEGMKR